MKAAKNIEKQWFTMHMKTGLSKTVGSWKKSAPNLVSCCTGLFLIII